MLNFLKNERNKRRKRGKWGRMERNGGKRERMKFFGVFGREWSSGNKGDLTVNNVYKLKFNYYLKIRRLGFFFPKKLLFGKKKIQFTSTKKSLKNLSAKYIEYNEIMTINE